MQGTRTKIVCTLGPSTSTTDILVDLIRSGMDVARLNLSHGTHSDHLAVIQNLREAAGKVGEEVGILLDLQGPKFRIGKVAVPMDLHPGDRLTITTKQADGRDSRVSTTFHDLPKCVRQGDRILLDDGRIVLAVKEIKPSEIHCSVVTGGRLTSNKGMNLPGVEVNVPSLTDKDLDDLKFGMGHGIDYAALSFVRSADDVQALRNAINSGAGQGHEVPVIAKIEKPEAVRNIDSIIAAADGIMIARGDLGVELSPEEVPVLQKQIIRKCNEAGKPVVIATQMLESMIANPAPTRAEASDVANAVLDGGDALMLSGETSVGQYPLEAVKMMGRIIDKVESGHLPSQRILDRPPEMDKSRHDALGRAACVLAEQMGAVAIVAVTRSGSTARVVSRYRPHPRIIAVTDSEATVRRMNLVWGVNALRLNLDEPSDRMLRVLQDELRGKGFVASGDHIVLVAGQSLSQEGARNFVKVEKIS